MDTNGILLNIVAIGFFMMVIYFQIKIKKLSKDDYAQNKKL